MQSYAILGTGAVGGYYGALLQRAWEKQSAWGKAGQAAGQSSGSDVHFLVRGDYAHIKKHGLRIDSPKGNFHLDKVSAYDSPDSMPKCDVAVVAWKSTENAHLADALPKVLHPGGTVLVLQNGLDPERDAAAAVPEASVLSGLCFLCSRKAGPGWIQHLDYGAVTLARYSPERSQGVTAEMRMIGEDLKAAGVDIRLHEDWRAARWRKLVWNIPFNGLCALLGRDTAQLMRNPETRARIGAMIDEVIAGAAACGCSLPGDFRDRMMKDTDAMAPYEPSMKLDRDAGRPMELEAIYFRPLQAIAEAGGRAPLMEALYQGLRALETQPGR